MTRIVDTPISPELVPGKGCEARRSPPKRVVGPYELQDFHLYYVSRFGYRPSKVAFLAHAAWGDAARGAWPDTVPEDERRAYDLATIRHWLEVFLRRFFQTSQFKRSAMPNGPKVGSGGSLSPRSDWRAPSDSPATVWLEELRANVPACAGEAPNCRASEAAALTCRRAASAGDAARAGRGPIATPTRGVSVLQGVNSTPTA